MTTIVQAATADEIAEVGRLMRAFASGRHEQLGGHNAPAEWEFEDQEFENGLAELPPRFAPPHGRLLIALEGDLPAGCAALCDVGDGVCEAKAIFVAGLFRGQRVGRALLERLLLEARAAGYRRMCLGTSHHENEAMRLCERGGFHQIRREHEMSDRTRSQRVLFEQDLRLAS